MKTLIILVLAAGLAAALFFTRPTKADFERYVREELTVSNAGTATGGKTALEKVAEQFKTLVPANAAVDGFKSPADRFLEQCEFENYYLWTNVKKDGRTIYTGAVNHWFERAAPEGAVPAPLKTAPASPRPAA